MAGASLVKPSSSRPQPGMAAHAARLARLLTPEYACRINAQIVHPAQSQLIKPNELESALARPLHVAVYEPDREATYLAASLSYGIIKGTSTVFLVVIHSALIPHLSRAGHPFLDGNKRTGKYVVLFRPDPGSEAVNDNYMPAFFLANEYLRAQGLPGLLDELEGRVNDVYQGLVDMTPRDMRLLNWHHANLEYQKSI